MKHALVRRCKNPLCKSPNFLPSNNRQLFCSATCRATEHKRLHGTVPLDTNLLPQTCSLYSCDAPINRGTVRKVAFFCCDAHRHQHNRDPFRKRARTKLGICAYETCATEYIKTRYDQKYCCPDHRKFHSEEVKLNKKLLRENRTKYRLTCEWTGDYFESYNKRDRFATKNYRTYFYNSGYREENVIKDQEFRDHSFDEMSLENKVFVNCVFDMATFNHAKLNKTRFANCQFEHCDFYFTSLIHTVFLNNEWIGNNTFEQCLTHKFKASPPFDNIKNISFKDPIKVGRGKNKGL